MKRMITLVATAATLAVCTGAFAQATGSARTDMTPHYFSFRAGAVFPFDSSLSDVQKTWIGIGADWRLPSSLLKDGETYVSVDWVGQDTKGTNGNAFPIMLNQKFWGEDSGSGRAYAFAGVGVVFFDQGPSDNVLGMRGGVGKELSRMVFIEAALTLSEKAKGGQRLNSLAAYIGYRF